MLLIKRGSPDHGDPWPRVLNINNSLCVQQTMNKNTHIFVGVSFSYLKTWWKMFVTTLKVFQINNVIFLNCFAVLAPEALAEQVAVPSVAKAG